jgi:aerobic C4-dicarboxylate transport protein
MLVLSVDWFIGMARALGNLIGNCVATVVVAASEVDLDRAKAQRVLDGTELVDVTAGLRYESAATKTSMGKG